MFGQCPIIFYRLNEDIAPLVVKRVAHRRKVYKWKLRGHLPCCGKNNAVVEIRKEGKLEDGRPALDEILARGALIHLEQMAHGGWALRRPADLVSSQLWVTDRKSHINLSDEGEEYADWDGDSRKRTEADKP